ncbi:MAG: hypothetical protein IPK85_02990 [Gemmatimonadetes bacterium]|nr:hypothetical protein [Gemmatimonadota bacterium]
MIIVNAAELVFFSVNGARDSLVLPSPVAALFAAPVVVRVGEASAEVFLPVDDRKVRRAGHEAVARLAQMLFEVRDQHLAIESANGSVGFGLSDSAWGLRVVVLLDDDGRPLWAA